MITLEWAISLVQEEFMKIRMRKESADLHFFLILLLAKFISLNEKICVIFLNNYQFKII